MNIKIILVGLFSVLVLGLISFILYSQFVVLKEDDKDESDAVAEIDFSVPKLLDCTDGDLIDTHLHLEDDSVYENILVRMEENNVACSLAFVYMNPEDPKESFEIVQEGIGDNLNRFILFFFVTPQSPSDINAVDFSKVFSETNGYFSGAGEIAFYREPLTQSKLTDPLIMEVFELAENEQLFIMIHLRGKLQVPELEEILTAYPNAKILLHGPELYAELPDLLTRFDNLYFTLDTASLILEQELNQDFRTIYMYTPEEKVGLMNVLNNTTKKEEILNASFEKWLPVIEAAPDRVMWGTDVSMSWHTDEDVYRALVDFSNEFIQLLPVQYQEGYAKENALRIFSQ